jgi:hypothetical protein
MADAGRPLADRLAAGSAPEMARPRQKSHPKVAFLFHRWERLLLGSSSFSSLLGGFSSSAASSSRSGSGGSSGERQQQRQRRQKQQLRSSSGSRGASGAGAEQRRGAGAGAGAGSSFLPQAARAAAAIRVASTSDFFISGFLGLADWNKFPEIVAATLLVALTERQGLEL